VPGTEKREFARILIELRRHAVDFIVVGGVAAVLEGVPVNTFDLDVVHAREPGNIDRLLAALESLDATYAASHLTSPTHQRLITRLGPIEILGSIGRSRSYHDLLPHAREVEVGQGLRVQVLNLETLIAVKEEVAGERDLAVIPTMRRTLEEKRRRR
jgi:predicted nucleotidyltransferase